MSFAKRVRQSVGQATLATAVAFGGGGAALMPADNAQAFSGLGDSTIPCSNSDCVLISLPSAESAYKAHHAEQARLDKGYADGVTAARAKGATRPAERELTAQVPAAGRGVTNIMDTPEYKAYKANPQDSKAMMAFQKKMMEIAQAGQKDPNAYAAAYGNGAAQTKTPDVATALARGGSPLGAATAQILRDQRNPDVARAMQQGEASKQAGYKTFPLDDISEAIRELRDPKAVSDEFTYARRSENAGKGIALIFQTNDGVSPHAFVDVPPGTKVTTYIDKFGHPHTRTVLSYEQAMDLMKANCMLPTQRDNGRCEKTAQR